jgi:prevent-host-death family protein
MQKIVGIRAVKAKLSQYVSAAREGAEVVITDRGIPVARLVGIAATVPLDPLAALASLAKEGLVEPGAGRRRLTRPARLRKSASPSQIVIDQRR